MAAKFLPYGHYIGIAFRCQSGGIATCGAAVDKKSAAAIVLIVALEIRKRAHLAGSRVTTAVEASAEYESRTYAGAESDAHHIVVEASRTIHLLAEGEAVGIVIHSHRHTESAFEYVLDVHFLPRGDVHHIVDNAFFPIHHRRYAYAYTFDCIIGSHLAYEVHYGIYHLVGARCVRSGHLSLAHYFAIAHCTHAYVGAT